MQVGVPGSGLGYAFYALSVAWMPIHELSRLVRGKSSADRWRRVARHVALLAGIVMALAGEWWLLARLHVIVAAIRLTSPSHDGISGSEAAAAAELGRIEDFVGPIVVLAPFVVIAVLCVVLQLLRLGLRVERTAILRPRQPRPAP